MMVMSNAQVVLHVRVPITSKTFILHAQFYVRLSMGLSDVGVVGSIYWLHKPLDGIPG